MIHTQQSILDESKADSRAICDLLSHFKYNFNDEKSLQDGMEVVLIKAGMQYRREFHVNRKDRPDFMLSGGLAIEVKIKGSQSQFLRQASRYLLDNKITALILVGTPHWINSVPSTLHNKPISKLRLLGSMF